MTAQIQISGRLRSESSEISVWVCFAWVCDRNGDCDTDEDDDSHVLAMSSATL